MSSVLHRSPSKAGHGGRSGRHCHAFAVSERFAYPGRLFLALRAVGCAGPIHGCRQYQNAATGDRGDRHAGVRDAFPWTWAQAGWRRRQLVGRGSDAWRSGGRSTHRASPTPLPGLTPPHPERHVSTNVGRHRSQHGYPLSTEGRPGRGRTLVEAGGFANCFVMPGRACCCPGRADGSPQDEAQVAAPAAPASPRRRDPGAPMPARSLEAANQDPSAGVQPDLFAVSSNTSNLPPAPLRTDLRD